MTYAIVLCILSFPIIVNTNEVLRRELDRDHGKYCFKSLGDAMNEKIEVTDKMNKVGNKCNGGISKSHAVAFTAILTDGNALSDGPVLFGNVLANVGNSYDKRTGIFTAPVAGLYIVSVSIMGYFTNNVTVAIKKNGTELVRLWTEGNRHEVSSHAINIPLAKGDQLWACGTAGRFLHVGGPYNVFSVALITGGTF